MDIHRISAFSQNGEGGNPAGVALLEAPVSEAEMARVAAEVGYSETAFAVPTGDGPWAWRVRYFSPGSEVPFCGHATIALGAVLCAFHGPGTYSLTLNDAEIAVEAARDATGMAATLTSPPTHSRAAGDAELRKALALFGLTRDDLDHRLPPARIHAGADHIMLALKDRATLASMNYDFDRGREVMNTHGLVTIMLVHAKDERTFSARNAFASGGVVEDPATGAAAAAFAGYLRDIGWPHGGQIVIRQGEDMGAPSKIEITLSNDVGSPVRVSGRAHAIEANLPVMA